MRKIVVLSALLLAPVLVSAQTIRYPGSGSGGSGGHEIEEEGTPLTQRSNLNFTGSAITCSDSGGKTVCDVTGGSVTDEGIEFEGTTADAFETSIVITDPTADNTITIPADIDWTVRCLVAGTGIAVANACGLAAGPSIALDTAVVFLRSETTSLPATCTAYQDWFTETDLVPPHLYFCNETDTWVRVFPALSPVTTLELYDDFMTGVQGTTGSIGALGWGTSNIGSPTGAGTTTVTGTADNPGYQEIDTGTGDNTGININLSSTGTAPAVIGLWTTHAWEMDTVILTGMTSDVTQVAFWFGLQQGAPDASTGGIYFRYDTDASHTNWGAFLCDSSTTGCQSAGDDTNQDYQDTGVAVADDTRYRLRIRFHPTAGAGSTPKVWFTVNNGTPITFCASGCTSTAGNLEAADNLIVRYQLVARDTTEKHWGVDYFHLKVGSPQVPLARY